MLAAKKKLKGRRIAVLVADGFEEAELAVPAAALRAEGAEVEIVSLRRGRIRGVRLHEPVSRVQVDRIVAEAHPEDYDGLFIPGGFISPDLMRQSSEALDFVRAFDVVRKPIATLCHGPWLLASAGLLEGRRLTSWPGVRDDVVNAGGTWFDEEVTRDGNWVTSRGPQDLVAFVHAITDLFAELGPIPLSVEDSRRGRSDPQRGIPPRTILATMKWLPKPPVRVMLAVGAITASAGALLLAMRRIT